MAGDQPTADVAESDYPVSVLGRQCVIHRMSNVEPLSTLLLSGGIRCVRSSHAAPPAAPNVRPGSTQPLVTNDVVCSIHCRPRMRIKAQCGCFDTHSGKICGARKNALTVTEKNPGQSMLPGLLQVVASACRLFLIRAARLGDGVPPGSGLLDQRKSRNLSPVSPHNVALKASTRRQPGAIMLEV